MDSSLTLWFTFVAGIVSFLSPCVLPLIPGFLSYLAGTSGGQPSRGRIFVNTIFFVIGFAVVFSLIGVLLNSLLAPFAESAKIWLGYVGGAIIIFFGLVLSGLLHVTFLEKEHKFSVQKTRSEFLTSFLFGAAFAAGWSPCVGAVLGAVLTLAASNPGQSFILLISYTMGLGVPFLVVGLFTDRADRLIQRFAGALVWINRIFGVFLILIGMLIFTGQLSLLANLSILNSILLAR